MKRVCLVSLKDPFLANAGDRFPLGIGYLGAALQQRDDYEIILLDMNHNNESYLFFQASRSNAIGISFTTPQATRAYELSEQLRHNYPDLLLIAGGPHPSALPKEPLKHGFSTVIVGEGEECLDWIIDMNYKGVFESPRVENLDRFPYPARELIDMRNYNMVINGKRTATMITSRGCPNRCAYCSKQVYGRSVRYRSIKNIVLEIISLMDDYNYKGVYFQDDVFTASKKRTNDLCDAIRGMHLNTDYDLSWRATTRADFVNKDLLKNMKRAGCDVISFGVESGDDIVLKRVGKNMSTVINKQAIGWARSVGMRVKGFFILGLPGETKESALKTIEFSKSCGVNTADFYFLTPFPGSDIWHNPKSYGIRFDKKLPWDQYLQAGKKVPEPIIETEHLSKSDLMELMSFAKAEWG